MGFRRLVRDIALNGVCSTSIVPRSVRWRLLRAFGLAIEGWCAISPHCWFGGTNIAIGRDSTVNYGCFFDNSARVTIGRRVDVGMQVMFCTSSHEAGPVPRRDGPAFGNPIEIGDGTWIGARTLILPGVSVGSGCVMAAGSVVNRDGYPNGLYSGVPAQRLRELS